MKVPRHLPAIPMIIVVSFALAACGDSEEKPSSTTHEMMDDTTSTTHEMMDDTTSTTHEMMDDTTSTTGG